MPTAQRLSRSLLTVATRTSHSEHHIFLGSRCYSTAGRSACSLAYQTPRHTFRQPPPRCTSYYLHRTYYTPSTPEPNPFPAAEEAILAAALQHVPTHGFTTKSLTLGAVDAGYLPSSVNLFPSGAFDLVRYHLVTQRLHLKNAVQFPTPLSDPPSQGPGPRDPNDMPRTLGVGSKVRALVLARLHANEPIIEHLPEALGLMSLAGNIPASTAELGRLVDEIPSWSVHECRGVSKSRHKSRL
jgi:ubiquinone biosynthesis protein COQ9